MGQSVPRPEAGGRQEVTQLSGAARRLERRPPAGRVE